MKNVKIKPLNLLFNISILAIIFYLIGINIAWAVPVGVGSGIFLGYVKSPDVALWVTIQKEIWQKDIQDNLYKSNAFLNTFSKADQDNINGISVHIPQTGKGGDTQKNRTNLPAAVKKRTDTLASYQINEFTSDPILIPNADTVELSYDKRESVLSDEQSSLNEGVAEDLLLSVVKSTQGTVTNLPDTSILSTEGLAVDATLPGATGKVKAYSIKDLQKGRNFFKRQKIWTENKMYVLLTSEAETQMFPADSQVTATYMAAVSEEERRNGVMYKCQGFQIISRSSVFVLSAAGAFKPWSAETEEDDIEGVIFYNGNQVEFALGDIKFFEKKDDPTYYGDVYSFLVRAGGRAKRLNFEGVMVMKQTPTV